MEKVVSEKKEKLLNDFRKTPIQVGEQVSIVPEDFGGYSKHSELFDVIEINGDKLTVKNGRHIETYVVDKSIVRERYVTWTLGANPFVEKFRNITPVNFTLDSIIFQLELVEKRRDDNYHIGDTKVQEVNWNPYVYDKDGNKQRFQRDFIWSLEQKQRLIESIYKGINCGTILIRKRGWTELVKLAEKGETELAFQDIVDGKQRLNAIRQFLKGKITDAQGNYYGDLSYSAQHKFGTNQLLQYAEMREDSTDEETLFQFLKMNHEGVPQSKEHLDFVANLLK